LRHYRLQPQPLTEVDVWVGRYRGYLERELDALGRVLDAMQGDPPPHAPPKQKRRAR